MGDSHEEQSEREPSPKKSAANPDLDEGLGSPSRTDDSSGTSRRSRSPKLEKERKLKSAVARVLGKKLPRNPYHESRRYSSTSTSDRTSASSSSRSRHREDSSRKPVRNPDPRDYKSSRREEDRKRSSRSYGRR